MTTSNIGRIGKWGCLAVVALLARLLFFWANPAGPEVDVRALEDLRQAPTDVVFLGDSVMDYVADGDTDRTPLSGIVRAGLRGCTSVNLARSASHAEIFEPIVRFLSQDQATRPGLVIVPLNLRSFSNSWVKHPAYRFEEYRRMLNHDSVGYNVAHRPLAAFRWYQGVEGTQEDYDRSPVYDGDRIVATLGQMNIVTGLAGHTTATRQEQLSAAFRMRYAQRIMPDDQRLHAVIRLTRLLKERHVSGLFYITPVDWATGQRYAGPRLTAQIAENAGTLVDVLTREGVAARDWSRELDASGFSWHDNPNEHLSEQGRRGLAALVTTAARDELRGGVPCGIRARPR